MYFQTQEEVNERIDKMKRALDFQKQRRAAIRGRLAEIGSDMIELAQSLTTTAAFLPPLNRELAAKVLNVHLVELLQDLDETNGRIGEHRQRLHEAGIEDRP